MANNDDTNLNPDPKADGPGVEVTIYGGSQKAPIKDGIASRMLKRRAQGTESPTR